MPDDSARHGVVITLQVLLAMLFLAIIGGVVGYLAGVRVKDHRRAGVDRPVGAGVGDGAGSTSPVPSPSRPRCLEHTEELAGTGPLWQLLYLRTRESEVWICADAGGRLFYQGHSGQPGEPLVEGKTSLFLTDVVPEGTDGYLATNRAGDRITEYHVDPRMLVKRYINYTPPKPDRTERAVRP